MPIFIDARVRRGGGVSEGAEETVGPKEILGPRAERAKR